jgi:hypothetical protein
MATIDEPYLEISPPTPRAMRLPERGSLLSHEKEEDAIAAHWQNVWHRLTQWLQRPGDLDEDGWESPSLAALEAAHILASALHKYRPQTTFSLNSNGEGGISFEMRDDSTTELFEIDVAGAAEYLVLRDSVVTERTPIELE